MCGLTAAPITSREGVAVKWNERNEVVEIDAERSPRKLDIQNMSLAYAKNRAPLPYPLQVRYLFTIL